MGEGGLDHGDRTRQVVCGKGEHGDKWLGRCQVLWGCLDESTCCRHLVMLVVVAVEVHVLSSFCCGW